MSTHCGPRQRLKSLDLLRLLLCLLVMTTHARRIFGIGIPVWFTKGIFDGKAGVVLFFVLSGYVLTKSLARTAFSWESYQQFIIKRAFRLFPLYWIALGLTLIVLLWLKQDAAGLVDDEHLQFLAQTGPDWRQWFLHLLLLVPGMNSDFALPTVWSLMTEAKVSMLAFPLFGWLILRLPLNGAAATVALLVLGSDFLYTHILGTAAFLGIFGLGALLARVPDHIWHRIPATIWRSLLAIGGGLYACMSLRYLLPSVWIGYYLCALGATLIIACVSHWPTLSLRMHALHSVFGADLSYGIYLLHYPVLLIFFRLSTGHSSPASFLCALLAMVITIALAWLLAHAVELPMIKLGRRLAHRSDSPSADCHAVRDFSS